MIMERSVYLLRSPEGRTYIGCTGALDRRLRQHNGEIAGGARRTKRSSGWVRVAHVAGFRSPKEALQFEWGWQHPTRSRRWRGFVAQRGFTVAKRLHQVRTALQACPEYAHLALVYEEE